MKNDEWRWIEMNEEVYLGVHRARLRKCYSCKLLKLHFWVAFWKQRTLLNRRTLNGTKCTAHFWRQQRVGWWARLEKTLTGLRRLLKSVSHQTTVDSDKEWQEKWANCIKTFRKAFTISKLFIILQHDAPECHVKMLNLLLKIMEIMVGFCQPYKWKKV